MAIAFRKLLFLFAAALLSAPFLPAQALELSEGSISFQATEKNDVKAENTAFKSTMDPVAKTISFEVPIESFEFKMGLMKKHFLDESVMNALGFPNASFEGDILADSDITQEGFHDVQAEGKLTILETTMNVLVNGTLELKDGHYQLKSNFMVNGKEYGIDSGKVSGFADSIEVRVDASYQ